MPVTITWDDDAPLTGQPDSGSASKTYTEAGAGTVTVADEAIGGPSRTLTYTVPLPLTEVQADPAQVDSAGTIGERTTMVAGQGFPASATGTVAVATGVPGAWGTTVAATGATTNASGIFTEVELTVPPDTDAGDYHLEVTFGDIADLSTALTVVNTELVAPTNLASPSQTSSTVELTWDAVTGAEQYVIRWKASADTEWTERPPVNGTTDTVSGLTPETSYDFQVKATAEGSTDSPWAPDPEFSVSTAPMQQMDTPTGLAVGTTTTDSVPLTWDAVTTPAPADNYTVRWRLPGDSWNEIPGIVDTNHTVTGLDPDTAYEFSVRAVADGFTESDWFTPPVEASTQPLGEMDVPTGLTSSNVQATSLDLDWDDVTTPVAAEAYGVEQSDDGGTTWDEIQIVPVSNTTVTGLTSATPYQFRVAARATGYTDSDWSAAHSVTTA